MKDGSRSSDWIESIESAINALGKGLGLIWLLLMLVILVNVISRYLFNQGFIQLEELQWHLYATGFLLGLSFAVTQDVHVRVDVLRERWSQNYEHGSRSTAFCYCFFRSLSWYWLRPGPLLPTPTRPQKSLRLLADCLCGG